MSCKHCQAEVTRKAKSWSTVTSGCLSPYGGGWLIPPSFKRDARQPHDPLLHYPTETASYVRVVYLFIGHKSSQSIRSVNMVLTGVEIVGIGLAVVPLCITALEHHQDEIRPFKMLFRYKTQAQKARQQFGVVHSRFRQVIELIVRDLSLSPSHLNALLSSLHGTVDASVWSKGEIEQALIDHFGIRDYKTGFLPLIETILENIKDISRILSVDVGGDLNNANVRKKRDRYWTLSSSTDSYPELVVRHR